MIIEDRKLINIKPYPKNAKDHPEKQLKKIAASISEFGFNQPVVIDKEGVIVVGHGRYLAAQRLKMESVPTIQVDLTEEQAKAYRLADNKLNESDWDMDVVIEELKSIESEKMLDLTGFDANVILETKEDKPELRNLEVPKSVEGDIYTLGNHKIICGDATKKETYEKLLGEERPRLIFTDPPYSIDYHSVNKKSKNAPGGATYSSDKFGAFGGRIFNDDKTPAEALEFYRDALKQIYDFSSPDATIYWWFATRLTDVSMQAMRDSGWRYSQTVIWLKNSIVYSPGQLFHRIYEPCMIAWKEKGEPHYQNLTFSKYSELWTLDQKTFAEYLDVWYQKRDNTNKYIHPTQKPVQLAERALKRSSKEKDIVLDTFGGSGSTMIACDQLNRHARLMELDPEYVDATINRYLKYTKTTHVIKNGEKILW